MNLSQKNIKNKSFITSFTFFIGYTIFVAVTALIIGYILKESKITAETLTHKNINNLTFYKRAINGIDWINDIEQRWVCFDYEDYQDYINYYQKILSGMTKDIDKPDKLTSN